MKKEGSQIKRGLIRSDEIWSGRILISSTVQIRRGIKVRVLPGTEINIEGGSGKRNPVSIIRAVEAYNSNYSRHIVDLMEFPLIDNRKVFIEVQGELCFEGEKAKKISVKKSDYFGGIVVNGNEALMSMDNTQLSDASVGVYALNKSVVRISNSEIKESGIGILLYSSCLKVSSSEVSSNRVGILLADPVEVDISDNTIENNFEYGIVFNSNNQVKGVVRILENKIFTNDVGIHLSRTLKPEISKNSISQNRIGVYLSESPSSIISDNAFMSQKGNDIIAGGGVSGMRVERNTFAESHQVMDAMQDAELIFSDNIIRDSFVGVSLRERARAILKNNSFDSENSEMSIAIGLSQESEAVITENTVRGASAALRSSDFSHAEIRKNSFSVSSSGISADGMSVTRIYDNEISSKETALLFEGESTSEVGSNILTGETGLITDGISDILFENNSVCTTSCALRSSGQSQLRVLFSKIESATTTSPGMDIFGLATVELRESRLTAHMGLRAAGDVQLKIISTKINSESSGIIISGASRCLIEVSSVICRGGICYVASETTFSELSGNSFRGSCGFEIRGESEVNISESIIEVSGYGMRTVDQGRMTVSGGVLKTTAEVDFGIHLSDMSQSHINGLEITGFKTAIKTEDSAESRFVNTSIRSVCGTFNAFGRSITLFKENRIIAESGVALSFSMESVGEIVSNYIESPDGILQDGSSAVRLSNNTLKITAYGVFLREQSRLYAEKNNLESSTAEATAFYLSDLSEGKIIRNSVKGFGLGVLGDFNADLSLIGNIIETGLKGIEIAQEVSATLRENKVKSPYGVYQSGNSEADMKKNEICSSEYGIYAHNTSQSSVSENTFQGAGEDSIGLYIGGSASSSLSQNHFFDFGSGCKVDGSATLEAAGNDIKAFLHSFDFSCNTAGELKGNEITAENGIYQSGMSSVLALENSFKGVKHGLYLLDQSKSELINNTLEGRGVDSVGFYCGGVSEAVLSSNTLTDFANGLKADSSSNIRAVKNRLEVTENGFSFIGMSESSLEDNEIISESSTALIYMMESRGSLKGNKISGRIGIECAAASQIDLDSNTIEFKLYGINACENATLNISRNLFSGGEESVDGIFLAGFTQSTLNENKIKATRALFVTDNAAATAEKNRFEGVDEAVSLSGSSESRMARNEITSENATGVLLSLEATALLSENRITAERGIQSSGSSQLELLNNDIISGEFAAHLSGNTSAILSSNKLQGDPEKTLCIEAAGNSEVQVLENNITGFKDLLRVYESSSFLFRANRADKVAGGMKFEGCAEADISENEFVFSAGDCMIISERASVGFSQNKVKAPGGISTFASSVVRCVGNIMELEGHAFRLSAHSQGIISRNTFLISGESIIAVTVNGVAGAVFSDNNLTVAEGTAFFISSESECEIKKNNIIARNGVEGNGMGSIRFLDNHLETSACAIRMDEQGVLFAENNHIKGDDGKSSGVELTGLSRSEVYSNNIEDVMVAFKLDTSSKLKLFHNTVYATATVCEAGGTSEVIVSSNRLHTKKGIAFAFRLEATGVLSKNLINSPGCIDLSGSSQVESRENAYSFTVFGIRGSGQSRGIFSDNTYKGNASNAVSFDLADASEIEALNERVEGVHTGIKTADSSRVRVEGSRIDARNMAFFAGSVSEVVSEGNYIKSADLGISLDGESSGVFYKNLFFVLRGAKVTGISHLNFTNNVLNTSEFGMICSDQVSVSIKEGSIKGEALEHSAGVEVSGMSEVSIEETSILDFTLNIKILEEARASLRNNTIKHGVIGIKIEDLTEVTVTENKILNNQVGIKYNSKISSLKTVDNLMRDNAVNIYDSCLETAEPPAPPGGKDFLGKLREQVIQSGRKFPFNALYRLYYFLAVYSIGVTGLFILRSKIYLRRGLLLKDWVPGLSDVDLFILIKERPPSAEKRYILLTSKILAVLKKIFPVLGEIHSGTEDDLKFFMKYGGVRAWEAEGRWRPILHSRRLPSFKSVSDIGFRLSCASEMLNSLQAISSEIFSYEDKNTPLRSVKAAADLLKYIIYLEGGREKFSSRLEVFEKVLKSRKIPAELRELLLSAEEAWKKRESAEITLPELYHQLLMYITPALVRLKKEVLSGRGGGYRVEEYSGEPLSRGSMPEWKGLCIRLRSGAEKSVRKIIQENPGLFYIVTENKMSKLEFSSLVEGALKVKRESLMAGTKIFFLTEAMYELMASALHFEIPNNFAFSEIPGGYRIKEFNLYKRFECETPKSGPRLFLNAGAPEMIREAAAKTLISYRFSFREEESMETIYYYLYRLNKPVEILIALKDQLFLNPPVTECIGDYLKSRGWKNSLIERLLEEFSAISSEEVNSYSPGEIFFEYYEELRETIDELRKTID